MKRWHLLAIVAVVAGVLWWRWRSRTLNVNASVTIPQDEIRVSSSRSIFQVTTGKSDPGEYGPPAPLGSVVAGGITTAPDELYEQLTSGGA